MTFEKWTLGIVFFLAFGLACPEKGLAGKWNQPDETLLPKPLRPYTRAVGQLQTPTGSGTCWIAKFSSQRAPPFILTAAHVVEEIYETKDYRDLKASFDFGTFSIRKVVFFSDHCNEIFGSLNGSLTKYQTDLALVFLQSFRLPTEVPAIPLGCIGLQGKCHIFPVFNNEPGISVLGSLRGRSGSTCTFDEKLLFNKSMFGISRQKHITIEDDGDVFSIIRFKPQMNTLGLDTLNHPTFTREFLGTIQSFCFSGYTKHGSEIAQKEIRIAKFELTDRQVARSALCDTLTQYGISFSGASGSPLLLAESGVAIGLACTGLRYNSLEKFCKGEEAFLTYTSGSIIFTPYAFDWIQKTVLDTFTCKLETTV